MSIGLDGRDAIGVGLVGAGGFGRRLGLAVQAVPGLRLVAVHDADPGAAAGAAAALDVRAVADLDALVADPAVRAVVVGTPHAAHVPVGLTAVAAGRHVFVEKPLSLTVAEGQALVDAAERARVTLLVGHVTRLLPVVQQGLALLDAGRIGDPVAVSMVRHQHLRRDGWRAVRAVFGMLLHSPAVHNLDLMNWILGRAVSVTALAAPQVQSGLEYPDVLSVLVGYERGRVGSLAATISDPLYAPEGTNSVRVIGERGAMAFDIATGRIDLQPTGAPGEMFELGSGSATIDAALIDELANFAAAIRGDAEPFVAPSDAVRAVELCEAADRSIASGGTVALPLMTSSGAHPG